MKWQVDEMASIHESQICLMKWQVDEMEFDEMAS